MRFVGNVSALFVVAVSHGLDTNPAAVRAVSEAVPPKALDASFWCLTFPGGPPKVLEAHLTLNAFRRQFRRQTIWKLILVGNVSALFVVAVSHGFWCLTFHSGPPKVLEAHSAPNAFRRQRFGIVRGRCRMVRTRILLLFGCFGSGLPKALDASFWCLTFPGGPPKGFGSSFNTLMRFVRQFRRQRFGSSFSS